MTRSIHWHVAFVNGQVRTGPATACTKALLCCGRGSCTTVIVLQLGCLLLQVANPMDLATLLMRVDERRYPTITAWLADLDLIVTATHQVSTSCILAVSHTLSCRESTTSIRRCPLLPQPHHGT